MFVAAHFLLLIQSSCTSAGEGCAHVREGFLDPDFSLDEEATRAAFIIHQQVTAIETKQCSTHSDVNQNHANCVHNVIKFHRDTGSTTHMLTPFQA